MNIPTLLDPRRVSNIALADAYRRYPGPYAITSGWQADLDKMFPGIMGISYDSRKYPKDAIGETNESETELIYRVVTWLEPGTLVEFGTLYGRTTRIMGEQSPLEARVLTVDLPDEARQSRIPAHATDEFFMRQAQYSIGAKYRESHAAAKITQLRMDATSGDFEESLDNFLKGSKIDFALLDVSNDYGTSERAFGIALPRMSYGGVIMIDDYAKPWNSVGLIEFFARKAREEGYVFYHFSPDPPLGRDAGALIFLNVEGAKNRNWRQATG